MTDRKDMLAHLPIVVRNSVQTWECDRMGHMNVQFYMARMAESAHGLLRHCGIDKAGLQFRTCHIRFLSEQLPGSAYHCRAGVVADSGADATLYIELRETRGDVPAMTCRLEITLAQPPSADAWDSVRCEIPPHGQARGLVLDAPRPRPHIDEVAKHKMSEAYTGEVTAHMCDSDGLFGLDAYIALVSRGIPNLPIMERRGMTPRSDGTIGGAALEYRFVYHARPRLGDGIRLFSGMSDLGEKTFTFTHWAFDAETGLAISTAAAVAISLDLKARKAVAIPPAHRPHYEAILDAGLSV